jgi:hypothetical protein
MNLVTPQPKGERLKLLETHVNKKEFIGLIFIVLLFSSLITIFFIPPKTERISLTARGEKNINSLDDEIVLLRINAGKKEIILNPVKGKWFWRGSQYMWRNKQDKRQPDGTTKTVFFDIPIGRNRNITFLYFAYGGIVDVSLSGKNHRIDTYSSGEYEKKYYLDNSENSKLVAEYFRKLIYFIIITILLISIFINIYKYRYYIKQYLLKNIFYIILFSLSLMMFLSMFSVSDKCSFWHDELCSLGISISPLNEIFKAVLLQPLSLFPFIGHAWYKIIPFGEINMRLLPEIIMTLTVYFMGLVTKEILGKRAAIFAALLTATSTYLARFGNNFYAYPLYVLCCIFLIWIYTIRIKEHYHEKKIHIFLYGISLAAFVYSLPIGFPIPFTLFVFDIILWIKRKIHIKIFISYLLASILYAPFVVAVLMANKVDFFNFWPGPPNSVMEFINVYKEIMNNNKYYICFYGISVVLLITNIIMKKKMTVRYFILFLCLTIPLSMMGMFYIYSHYINPKGSLWYGRYFICFFPMIAITCAYSIDEICVLISRKNKFLRRNAFLIFSILLCIKFPTLYRDLSYYPQYYRENFKDGINWLRSQNDIYHPTTAVRCTIGFYLLANKALNEFYILHQGIARADPFNMLEDIPLETKTYERIYVFSPHGAYITYEIQKLLEEKYSLVSEINELSMKVYDLKQNK